jgi:DNA replication protein DnaC
MIMEDSKTLWGVCLEKMRQYVKPYLFDVWFKPITCEGYDEATNTVTLCVPSKYICDYIEEYHLRMLSWALNEVFHPGVNLQYHIMQNADGHPVDFVLDASLSRTFLRVEDAADLLRAEMTKHVNGQLKWIPEYDEIASWLSDNRGRGLLLIGTIGLGKTLITRYALPALLQQRGVVQCDSSDMSDRIGELLQARCVIIDDLGTEPAVIYGQQDRSFLKLCDAAERNGLLLIVNTRLSTNKINNPLYPRSIQERYGNEVLDRLRATTRVVELRGQSMRK